MFYNNLKVLREKKHLTQEEMAKILKCTQRKYSYWETSQFILPLEKADELCLYYHCSMAYLLCEETEYKECFYKPMKYNKMLDNLLYFKAINNYTYKNIADVLECDESTVGKYFNGVRKINTDTLILLSRFFEIDIDKLCCKID